jgi:hypothetical protein
VTETDLANWGAKWGSPAVLVQLVEWSDKIMVE